MGSNRIAHRNFSSWSCVSTRLGVFGTLGGVTFSAGLKGIRPSSAAAFRAWWRVVWIPRTVAGASPGPQFWRGSLRPSFQEVLVQLPAGHLMSVLSAAFPPGAASHGCPCPSGIPPGCRGGPCLSCASPAIRSSHCARVILLCSVSSTPWNASIFCRSLIVSSFWVSA